ncbi:MAG: hypothetical protein Q8P20_00935 [bacterium]|nr:hypothetical protein [bacterium]
MYNKMPQEDQGKEIKINIEDRGDDAVGRVYSKENKKSKNLKSFSDFYKNRGEMKSELSKIEKKDPNRSKKIIAWVIVGLVIVLGVTLGGLFYFLNQEDKFGSESIDIEEIIPTLISSGDNVGITITVHNREAVDIIDAELIIQFPSDYKFNSSDPMPNNEANNSWSIGVIKSGSSKSIKLNGQIFGEINSSKEFKTILNYMPENFSSFFQKTDSFSLVINDSAYDLNLTVPTKVVNGFSSTYSVKITNNSEEDATNLQLSLTIPENLSVTSYNPEPDSGTIWKIDELKSGEEFEVAYEAILEGEEGDMAEIKAEIGYTGDNNEYIVQKEKSAIVFVVNPQLVLNIEVNESEVGFPVSMGDTLNYKISYQNNSQSEIKDLTINAILQGEILNWNSLADNNDGEIEDDVISWDSSLIEDLTSLKPGDEGEILFSINLSNAYVFSSDEEVNLSVVSSATAISDNVVDLDGGTLEVTSNEVENKVNSKLDLRAEGRYYDDEYIKVGDGPIPPAVGETTSYKVYWFLQNGANEVSDVEVTAVLPVDVTWVDDTNVSAGNISFNSTTRTVTWTINKLPEHVGQYLTELNAVFEISVTPIISDLGQVLILLNKSKLTATDSFTEEEITITQDIISSDLADDPLAIGDGLVVSSISTNTNSNTNTNVNLNTNTNTE